MTILCIDDEELGLQVRKLMLEQEGYKVLIASSAEQGLQLLKQFKIDAAILDFNMPGVDGAELAHLIREARPGFPIVMLSGYPDAVPKTALSIVNAFVTKGGAPEQLLLALRNAIGIDPSGKITILNVDDVAEHRYAITRVLRKAGFIVVEASTGMEALSSAAARPNLILLDINLPDMLGFEVCKQLKADPATRDIPVIHISATYEAQWAEAEALKAGADRFIEHPNNPHAVVDVVRSELRKLLPRASL